MQNKTHYLVWLWCIVLLLGSFPAVAQESAGNVLVTDVDLADYPTVRLSVADPQGNLPDPTTIEVLQDGTPVPTDTVEIEQVGVAVVIIIDLSRSMRGRGMPARDNRLQDAREQAIAIATALDIATDFVAVYTFNRTTNRLLPLQRADGGAVRNELNSDPSVQQIPPRPGDPTIPPTIAEYQNDDHAYAALSQAVSTAIDDLTNPQLEDQALIDRLARMQKAVVVFSDSCDDALTALDSVSCTIPADLQTRLTRSNETGQLAIFSVGVGVDDPQQGRPVNPDDFELGFAYNAQFELLERLAAEVDNSVYFELFAPDEASAAAVRQDFQNRVIDQILARRNQLIVSYEAPRGTGIEHEVTIQSGERRVSTTFQEPPIPPDVAVLVTPPDQEQDETARFPQVGLDIAYAQTSIVRAEYFINQSITPTIVNESPFVLDTSSYETGTYTVSVQAVDSRGQVSARSDQTQFTVLPPPPPNVGAVVFGYLIANAIPLIFGIITVMLVVVLLVMVSKRPASGGKRGSTASSTTYAHEPRQTRLMSPSVFGAHYALIVRQGPNIGTSYPLSHTHMYIGADKNRSDIVIRDEFMSGLHASIRIEKQTIYIVDEDSANHVYLDNSDKPIPKQTPVPIIPGSMITMGNTVLECVKRERGGKTPASDDTQPPHYARGSTELVDTPSPSPAPPTAQAQPRNYRSEKTVTYDEDQRNR